MVQSNFSHNQTQMTALIMVALILYFALREYTSSLFKMHCIFFTFYNGFKQFLYMIAWAVHTQLKHLLFLKMILIYVPKTTNDSLIAIF